MVINTDKTKLMLISSRQKRTNMKDSNLTLVYENFDLQVTSCENVLGVNIDDNLDKSFSIRYEENINKPLAFVSDKIISSIKT